MSTSGPRAPAASRSPPRNGRSAFHEDLKICCDGTFPDKYDGHKCTYQHAACLGATFAMYIVGWMGWWRGEVYTGVFLVGLCARLIMANLAHDGSHHAVSRRPWVNEISLLTSSPLLYSYGSWYQQHAPRTIWRRTTPTWMWTCSTTRSRGGSGPWEGPQSDWCVINLLWHFTAFLVSTANMSLTHPWKFVFVLVRRPQVWNCRPSSGRTMWNGHQNKKKAKKHAPHELAFFRISKDAPDGLFDGWRGLLSVVAFAMSVAFTWYPSSASRL